LRIKPIALTSIVEVVTAADLSDRSISIVPPPIEEKTRKQEREVLEEFAKEHPAILAALLDAVSHGLRTLPDITNKKWPRMADATKWITACEGAYDKPGTFLRAYGDNRANAISSLLANDMVATAVKRLALPWQGPIGALLAPLSSLAGDQQTRAKEWPKTPRGLGSVLRRLAPLLREEGIDIQPPHTTDKTRTWTIQQGNGPEQPNSPEQPDGKPLKDRGLGGMGGLGCSPRYKSGDPPAGEGGTPEIWRGKQPKQPNSPTSGIYVSDANGLDEANASGCCWAIGPLPPKQQPKTDADDSIPFPGASGGMLSDYQAALEELALRGREERQAPRSLTAGSSARA
jgi:hypothetical protein